MSPQDKTDKTDLGAKVDTLLGSWPAPSVDDAAWEERAARFVAAAQAAPRADDAALSALLAPPSLSPEAGEAERSTGSEGPARAVSSGVKTMSQDSNAGSSAKPPESMPTSAATSKRPSLKELAARASQAGASRPSIPGPASIPPAAISKPPSEAPPAPVTRTPLPSAPPKAAEASKEDSGVVDLNLINKTATAEQVAAAEKAKPATHDLAFDGDEKVAAASDAGKVKSLAEAREKKAEKKGGGATWGILVAVVGIAAAVTIVMRGQGSKDVTPTANVGQDKPPVAAEAQKPVEQKIAEAPPPSPTGLSLDSLPTEPSPSDAQKAAPTGGAAGGDPGKVAVAPTATATDAKAPAGPAPTIGAKPGDLAGAMAQAVGGSNENKEPTGEMVPAAGGNKGGNQTVPEQPSQGSVSSAVGSVMPGAKACVAGADDVSRAQITFSSGGTVSNVSVTGWAASNGQGGCVKAALKGANVGAFSKPSFTVGVTIRP